jgi:hypothetical protein
MTKSDVVKVLTALFKDMPVEGCDFQYNRANDYGSITLKLFVEGNPDKFCGDAETAKFYQRGVQETGRYFLTEACMVMLAERCLKNLNEIK